MRSAEEQVGKLGPYFKVITAEIEKKYKEVAEKLKSTEETSIDFEYEESV